ncbi:hypothetical protein C8R46DRAFT_1237054 [Mycena filopes]|nr:hypothetical protein C8R46DRAFT_1237054 [Mycena filopes]
MRTSIPELSSGYFNFQGSIPILESTTTASKIHNPSVSSRAPQRDRPSHKRHPKPRIFQKFGNHSTLPQNFSQFNLSHAAVAAMEHAMQHGWSANTLDNYGGTVDRFLNFCTVEGVPTKFQLPADEFVLCAFAASSAGVHAGSTVRNNIAALKAWHIAQGVAWQGSSRLHYVLAGVDNLAPESSKRAPRPPINAAMIRALYDGLDFSDPRDVAVFAAACVAFWGQCRLGELLPTSASATAAKFLPTRKHLSRSSRNKRSSILRLPRTKTQKNGDNVVLVEQTAPINPRMALDMHLLVNKCAPNLPLFSYSSRDGPVTLTKPKFLQRCNEI